MLLTHGNLFTPLDLKFRVFAKVPPLVPQRAPVLAAIDNFDGGDMNDNQRLRDLALEESPLPRIVVDANNTLALTSTKARVLFSLSPKDIGRPLQDLEISYRPTDLRSLIEQAFAERRAVTRRASSAAFRAAKASLRCRGDAALRRWPAPARRGGQLLDVTRATRLQEELGRSHEEIRPRTRSFSPPTRS